MGSINLTALALVALMITGCATTTESHPYATYVPETLQNGLTWDSKLTEQDGLEIWLRYNWKF